ncbi:MAG: hypothetical protein LBU87_01930 [Lactobacillales bacterium]|jgi:hypothetical protein|nr:hypothetical protein [Lactobacillales bacterium]
MIKILTRDDNQAPASSTTQEEALTAELSKQYPGAKFISIDTKDLDSVLQQLQDGTFDFDSNTAEMEKARTELENTLCAELSANHQKSDFSGLMGEKPLLPRPYTMIFTDIKSDQYKRLLLLYADMLTRTMQIEIRRNGHILNKEVLIQAHKKMGLHTLDFQITNSIHEIIISQWKHGTELGDLLEFPNEIIKQIRDIGKKAIQNGDCDSQRLVYKDHIKNASKNPYNGLLKNEMDADETADFEEFKKNTQKGMNSAPFPKAQQIILNQIQQKRSLMQPGYLVKLNQGSPLENIVHPLSHPFFKTVAKTKTPNAIENMYDIKKAKRETLIQEMYESLAQNSGIYLNMKAFNQAKSEVMLEPLQIISAGTWNNFKIHKLEKSDAIQKAIDLAETFAKTMQVIRKKDKPFTPEDFQHGFEKMGIANIIGINVEIFHQLIIGHWKYGLEYVRAINIPKNQLQPFITERNRITTIEARLQSWQQKRR